MAKFEGTQTIPAEWLNGYRGTLNPHPTGSIVKKRFPFRLPKMQKYGPGVSPGQLANRARFTSAVSQFKDLDSAQRSAWYDTMPEYSSFLWYYNWFMLSALSFDANVTQGGVAVIKGIEHYTATLPAGAPANVTIPISSIDPDRGVVMLFGAGAHEEEAYAFNVYPYLVSLVSTQAICKASSHINVASGFSITVIEYL